MKILITGVAGFVGFHTAKRCLEAGIHVVGIDNLSDYYDVTLKQKRVELLSTIEEEANSKAHFTFFKMDIEDRTALNELFEKESFDMVCNFAGQAGVRYSLENPQIYISTNIQGFFNLIDLATKYQIKRFIYASSSKIGRAHV